MKQTGEKISEGRFRKDYVQLVTLGIGLVCKIKAVESDVRIFPQTKINSKTEHFVC